MSGVDQTALSSGIVLADRYRLEDLINESSGASTWLARDQMLDRRVGVQALPSDDHRAAGFADAARRSTSVTDPHFLRVLDIAENDRGYTFLVREWARALALDLVLTQSTLTNRRAATIISEVAEAVGDAHEAGVYHRHLQPSCILLKESGAVRITGLAVDHAIRSPDPDPEHSDIQYAEQLDVQAIGKLLYACLCGRWPGGGSLLRRAPTEHGRLLRPRQVRAGVSRDVDTVCDRILGTPPRHHAPPLRSARQIAHELRLAGEDDMVDDQPSVVGISSPDLFPADAVAESPVPPPAVHPPKRRPKALEPPPPTTFERGKAKARRATQGDRALIWAGVVVAIALLTAMAYIVGRASGGSPLGSDDQEQRAGSQPTRISHVVALPVKAVHDFDPEGSNGSENPEAAPNAVDGDPDTGWHTSEYYHRADLGGLKDGVGLMLDLGDDRLVDSLKVTLGGSPTDVTILAAQPGTKTPPTSVDQLRKLGGFDDVDADSPITLRRPVLTRYVVVWLTKLPEKSHGVYQGDIREIQVRGTK